MEYDWQSTQSRVVDAVRDHPIPFALVGLGVGWLLVRGLRGRMTPQETYGSDYRGAQEGLGYGHAEQATRRYGAEYAGFTGSGPSEPSESEYRGGTIRDEVAETARGYTQAAAERTRDLGRRASEAATRAGHRAQDWAQTAREKVSSAGQTARNQASQLADRSVHTFQEHPIMIGSVALLVGAAIGASLPRSRGEARLASVGGFVDKARQAGERAIDAARESGAQAFERVKDTAAQAADEAFQNVREAGRSEAQPGTEGYRH